VVHFTTSENNGMRTRGVHATLAQNPRDLLLKIPPIGRLRVDQRHKKDRLKNRQNCLTTYLHGASGA